MFAFTGYAIPEPRLFHDLFQVRLAKQRLAHEGELRIHILLDRDVLDHRAQRRARIHEHARHGFVLVGQREHHGPAGQADDPRAQQ